MISIRFTPVLSDPDRDLVEFSKDLAEPVFLQDWVLRPRKGALLYMPTNVDRMPLIDPVEEAF